MEALLQAMLDASVSGMLLLETADSSREFRVYKANEPAERMMATPAGGLVGRPLRELFRGAITLCGVCEACWVEGSPGEVTVRSPEPTQDFRCKVGLVGDLIMVSLATVPSEHAVAAQQAQVDALRASRSLVEQLRRLADEDALTGLYNRRAWVERLESEIAASNRYGRRLSVLLLDADHFKEINDSHGHAIGDMVLHGLGWVLKQVTRSADTAGRYGGEEFAVLLPETGREDAMRLAERLRAAVAETSCQGVCVTVSIGVAEYTAGERVEALLNRADAALYKAKHLGRNCVHCLDTDWLQISQV